MLLGVVHVGEHVLARGVHQSTQLAVPVAQRIGDLVPLGEGLGFGVLDEDGADHGCDRDALLGGCVAKEVAGPVHAPALEAGAEDAAGGGPQALVIIGDD